MNGRSWGHSTASSLCIHASLFVEFRQVCCSSSAICQIRYRSAGTTTVRHHFSNLFLSHRGWDAQASDERTGIGGWYPTLDSDGKIDVWASPWLSPAS